MVPIHAPQSLDTERLVIRRLIEEDFQPFYSFMQDPEATRYLLFTEKQKTQGAVEELLMHTIHHYDTPEQVFALAITSKKDGKYVGSLGLQLEDDPKRVEIFYAIIAEHWGKGYGVEASREFLRYLFEECGVEEVKAFCYVENKPSVRVAENLGMQQAGKNQQEGKEGFNFILNREDYEALLKKE